MNAMSILLVHQEVEKLARRSARIATRVRGTDEQLLRPIRKSIEEEGTAAREYCRQIRWCLDNLCIIVRIDLDNTLVDDLDNSLSKIRQIRNNLIDLNRSLGLDRLRHFLRIRSNTVLFRQFSCNPLEPWKLSLKILETLRLQLTGRL